MSNSSSAPNWDAMEAAAFDLYCRSGMTTADAHRAAGREVAERQRRAGGSLTIGGEIIETPDGDPIGVRAATIAHFDETGMPIAFWARERTEDHEDV